MLWTTEHVLTRPGSGAFRGIEFLKKSDSSSLRLSQSDNLARESRPTANSESLTLLCGDLPDSAMGKLTLAVIVDTQELLVLKTTNAEQHSGSVNILSEGENSGESASHFLKKSGSSSQRLSLCDNLKILPEGQNRVEVVKPLLKTDVMDTLQPLSETYCPPPATIATTTTTTTTSSTAHAPSRYYWHPTLMQEAYVLARSGATPTITGAKSVPLWAVFYAACPSGVTHTVDVGARGRCQPEPSSPTENLYLALKCASGGDLYTWIENFQMRPSRVKGRLVLPIVSDISHVVRNLHHAGWVHRDIKPENVLLDTNYRAQLSDFGFSRPILTAEDRVGTVEYHSPELWHRGQNGAPADMWAIGMVLHRMLQRVDPQHFDAIVHLHTLKQNAAQLSTRRFEVARLTRLIECAFHCGAEWRMDAQAFRKHCATLCLPKKDVGVLWQVYQGCLQPNAQLRWTADQLCDFLQEVSSVTGETRQGGDTTMSKPMDEGEDDVEDESEPLPYHLVCSSFFVGRLSPIRLRPGFKFCPAPIGVRTWLAPSCSPVSGQQPLQNTECTPTPPRDDSGRVGKASSTYSSVASEPQHTPPEHSFRLLTMEYQNVVHDFARWLSQFMCWNAQHSVMAFQASVEVFACIICHLQPNPAELFTTAMMVRQIAALQLVETVLLDDFAAPHLLGFAQCQRSLESRLEENSTTTSHQRVQRVADIQHAWLLHLLMGAPAAVSSTVLANS